MNVKYKKLSGSYFKSDYLNVWPMNFIKTYTDDELIYLLF